MNVLIERYIVKKRLAVLTGIPLNNYQRVPYLSEISVFGSSPPISSYDKNDIIVSLDEHVEYSMLGLDEPYKRMNYYLDYVIPIEKYTEQTESLSESLSAFNSIIWAPYTLNTAPNLLGDSIDVIR